MLQTVQFNADLLRRAVIQQVMCQGELDFDAVERRWNIRFTDYFHDALPRLQELHRDGLIVLRERGFEITAAGRLLLRIVGMVFDKYHHNVVDVQGQFSKVIWQEPVVSLASVGLQFDRRRVSDAILLL